MRHIVTSRDGVQFAVNSAPNSVRFDQAFAKHRTAAELEAHGDFARLTDIDLSALVAPDPKAARPRPSDLDARARRARFTLIQGGKS